MSDEQAALNTDRELWREREGDYYADSIHVTAQGNIGIDCGGTVIVQPLRDWHRLATPPVTGEVGELVEELKSLVDCGCLDGRLTAVSRAAAMLERYAAALRLARNKLDEAEGWLAISSTVNHDQLCARINETIAEIDAALSNLPNTEQPS